MSDANLLAEYMDLLNTHGLESEKEREFLSKWANKPQLLKNCLMARRVKLALTAADANILERLKQDFRHLSLPTPSFSRQTMRLVIRVYVLGVMNGASEYGDNDEEDMAQLEDATRPIFGITWLPDDSWLPPGINWADK